jgi:tellurite resistance protein TerC
MTPLFLVLLLIESTDLVFAVDSIPAIYAVTKDPFIVFTSNIFAILGLRALFFVLQGYLAGLKYLKPALAAVLVFVGSKMLLVDVYKIPALVSLAVIVGILTVAIVASIQARKREEAAAEHARLHIPASKPATDGHGA